MQMVVLKKVKGSTLMETLIATVLIVIIFMVASGILNNLFFNTVKNDDFKINNYLAELQYNYINNNIKLPFNDTFNNWSISVQLVKSNNINEVNFEATHNHTGKTINKQLLEK